MEVQAIADSAAKATLAGEREYCCSAPVKRPRVAATPGRYGCGLVTMCREDKSWIRCSSPLRSTGQAQRDAGHCCGQRWLDGYIAENAVSCSDFYVRAIRWDIEIYHCWHRGADRSYVTVLARDNLPDAGEIAGLQRRNSRDDNLSLDYESPVNVEIVRPVIESPRKARC